MEQQLVSIILLLAGLLAVMGLIYVFRSGLEEKASKAACHDSLVYTAALMANIPAGETVKQWPSTCRTEDKVLEKMDHAKATDKIVDLMAECWYAMGEGKIRPFDTDWIPTEMKCFTCYTFIAPDLEKGIMAGDLLSEMNKKHRPDGRTYEEYLKTTGLERLIRTPPIAKDKVYAVLYSNDDNIIGAAEEGISIVEMNEVGELCEVREGEAT